MRTMLIGSLILVMIVLFGGFSEAGELNRIPVRGILTDSNGTPFDGMMDVTFALYSSQSDDTSLWAETYADLEIMDGFYSVLLGSNTFLDLYSLADHTEIWLGITVDTEKETNRIMLDSALFALERIARWDTAHNRGIHEAIEHQTSSAAGPAPVYLASADSGMRLGSALATSDGYNYTLPAAASVREGKVLYIYATNKTINLYPTGFDTLETENGDEITSASGPAKLWGGRFVSNGVDTWYHTSGS